MVEDFDEAFVEAADEGEGGESQKGEKQLKHFVGEGSGLSLVRGGVVEPVEQ